VSCFLDFWSLRFLSFHAIIVVDLPCLLVVIFAINDKHAYSALYMHILCTLRAPMHYLFWSSRACSAASSQNISGARLAHYTCTQAIIAAILAINDKHMLPIKHANTIMHAEMT
jgi:hypothetical protein